MSSRPALVPRQPVDWARVAVGLATMAACFVWGLPTFASYRDVADLFDRAVETFVPASALALAVVAAFNLVAPSVSQVAALPGLRMSKAVWADWSTTAVTNLMPGGSALAIGLIWAMYRSFGLERRSIARSIVVTGVWDVLVKLGTPLVALLLLSTQRSVDLAFVQAALVGGAMFLGAVGLLAILLGSARTARRIGAVLDRAPAAGTGWARRLEHLRTETVHLLRTRGWSLTIWTVVGHANLYVLLVLCVRAVGVDRSALSWSAVLAAFAFGRLVTALPLTPGGLGVLEVGLTGALTTVVAEGHDVPGAALVASVLLFRFFTFALPLPLGLAGLLLWNLRRPSAGASAQPPNDQEASADIT